MVAVRDDKCSISAAMLICKLDEEHQYKWYAQSSAYNGMNKDSAKNFIRDLFMPQIRSESVCSNQFNCYACVRHQIEANDALVMPL